MEKWLHPKTPGEFYFVAQTEYVNFSPLVPLEENMAQLAKLFKVATEINKEISGGDSLVTFMNEDIRLLIANHPSDAIIERFIYLSKILNLYPGEKTHFYEFYPDWWMMPLPPDFMPGLTHDEIARELFDMPQKQQEFLNFF